MSHLTQMAGLAFHNFVSAAAGAAVVVALIRGLVRPRTHTLGNFWVDLTRTTTRILLPMALVFAFVLVSQGAIQNFHAAKTVTTVAGQEQKLPGGPIASQEAIKEIGENGGGPLNANSSHPFENPNPITDVLEIWMLLAIPFALTWTFGKMAGDVKQGLAVLGAMFVLWLAAAVIVMPFEAKGNNKFDLAGVTQTVSATQAGGNMEGKEARFGPAASGLFAASTTGTSTGSVNSQHDSYTPAGGAVPLVNIMFGEVSPGGTGSGLYGMLVFALLSVFIAGLMVGRTPEYLGKKIQAPEMKLVVLYILFVPLVILGFTADVGRDEDGRELDRQHGTARPERDHLRVHVPGEQQRLRLRRPHGEHELVQHHGRPLHARRAVPVDDSRACNRGIAGPQTKGPAVGRHVPHEHRPVRGLAHRRRRHRRRADLLPRHRARSARRAARRKVLRSGHGTHTGSTGTNRSRPNVRPRSVHARRAQARCSSPRSSGGRSSTPARSSTRARWRATR